MYRVGVMSIQDAGDSDLVGRCYEAFRDGADLYSSPSRPSRQFMQSVLCKFGLLLLSLMTFLLATQRLHERGQVVVWSLTGCPDLFNVPGHTFPLDLAVQCLHLGDSS
jgi:hypothetical protein